jgi:hypothetical protein
MSISWEERINQKSKKKFSFVSNNFAFVIFFSINLGFLAYLKIFQKNQQVRKKKINPKGKKETNHEEIDVGPRLSSSMLNYLLFSS